MPLTASIPASLAEHIASEQSNMLRSMCCAVPPRNATYISGPITTGKKFVNWYLMEGALLRSDLAVYKHALRTEVIRKNESTISHVADDCRLRKTNSVIEPASLRMDLWGQKDYLNFWLQVLEKFASDVVLVDGWQYSAGCAAEFRYAARQGIPIQSHNGGPISFHLGRDMILSAAEEIEHIANRDEVLRELAANLRLEV